jgi:hypothetical protein
MKKVSEMSQVELAAYVQDNLQDHNIRVVLSGGSAVSFYSSDQYVSKDLDLINANFTKRKEIKSVMTALGFHEKGRYFINIETIYSIEFPDGPLSVGDEPVKQIDTFKLPTGTLQVISATDCVKDRLCAFYFWNDRQGLAQAILVAQKQKVDLDEINRWSKAQNNEEGYKTFRDRLRASLTP